MLLRMLTPRMLLGILLLPCIAIAQNNETEFQELYNNGIISISAEKVLYESEVSDHFFIHYQIQNVGQSNFELYLKEYHELFYPNQWGITDTTERMIIDERRIIPGLTDSVTNRILRFHKNGDLPLLKSGEKLDYYRDFNNGSKKDIRLKKKQYMYVSMDGQLFQYFDHGDGLLGINSADFKNGKYTQSGTIYLPYPLTFKKIPVNSIVFYEN